MKRSRELNDAIAANVKVNTDMEMKLIPRMTAQSFLAKLMGVAMVALSSFFYCRGTMDALTAVVMVVSAFIVYASLETAGNYSALLRVVDVSVTRAQEILDSPQMDISGETMTPERRDLGAENVSFSYEKRKVIDDITVQIPEKTTTAIVGPSGGGKTTLVNLLARFWDVDAGRVTLGGREGVRRRAGRRARQGEEANQLSMVRCLRHGCCAFNGASGFQAYLPLANLPHKAALEARVFKYERFTP